MNKKNCLVILSLILVAMPLLFSITSIVENMLIEYRMEQELNRGNLQTVTVDCSLVNWIKHGEEALVNGRMFDVKSVERNGRLVTLTGLFDIREENFKKTLQNFEEHQDKPYKAKMNFLVLLLGTCYNLQEPIVLNNPVAITEQKKYFGRHEFLSCSYNEIQVPPPRIIILFQA